MSADGNDKPSLPFIGVPEPQGQAPQLRAQDSPQPAAMPLQPQLPSGHPAMPSPAQNSPAPLTSSVESSDKNEMMKLLLALNEGVRSLGKRFDDYQ